MGLLSKSDAELFYTSQMRTSCIRTFSMNTFVLPKGWHPTLSLLPTFASAFGKDICLTRVSFSWCSGRRRLSLEYYPREDPTSSPVGTWIPLFSRVFSARQQNHATLSIIGPPSFSYPQVANQQFLHRGSLHSVLVHGSACLVVCVEP